jgi:hypothetical protein
MYKLEFVNALNQDLLREQLYKEPEHIVSMIASLEKNREDGLDLFLMDHRKRTLEGRFVSHKVIEEEGLVVYRCYFKVKLAKMQAKVRG